MGSNLQPPITSRTSIQLSHQGWHLNPYPAEPGYTLCKQCRSRSVGFWRSNWSGSALFTIKYVNLYQKPWSRNLIGWKLEMGVASLIYSAGQGLRAKFLKLTFLFIIWVWLWLTSLTGSTTEGKTIILLPVSIAGEWVPIALVTTWKYRKWKFEYKYLLWYNEVNAWFVYSLVLHIWCVTWEKGPYAICKQWRSR